MSMKKLRLLYGLIALLCIALVTAQVMALTPEGTVIGNAATATYTDEENNEYTTTSNIVQTVVLGICAVEVIVSQPAYNVTPDQELYVPVEVKNTSNMTRSFNMTTNDVGGTTATPYTTTIYTDTNQNGVVDAGESITTNPVELNMDETAYYVVLVNVPAGAASGETNIFSFTATDTADNTCNETGDDVTSTVVNDALIVASKQVDFTVSQPGGTLTYTIQYQNIGTQPARSFDGWSVDTDGNDTLEAGAEGILVIDELPTDTVYNGTSSGQPSNGYVVFSANGTDWYQNTAVAAIGGDAGVTHIGFFIPDSAPTDDAIENLLAVDQQGVFSFEVTIADPFNDPGDPAVTEDEESRVDNKATVYYNDSTDTTQVETPTNWVHTIVPSSETADISLGGWDTVTADPATQGSKWSFNGTVWELVGITDPTWEEDDSPAQDGSGNDGDYWDDNYASNVPAGSWVTFEHQVYNSDINNDDVISLYVDPALPNLPAGSIVEFWNADGTLKLIDTDADGNVDLGTITADSTKDFVVKVFIPATAATAGPADGTVDHYIDVQAISGNNNAETDLSRDNIDGILPPAVDIAERGDAGDNTNDHAADGDTVGGTGNLDGDDITEIDLGAFGSVTPGNTKYYEIQLVNTGESPDTYSLSAEYTAGAAPADDDTNFRFLMDPNCTLDADPDTGEPIPDGDEHEIVDTPLLGGTTITNVSGTDLTVENTASFAVGDTVIIGLGGTANTTTVDAVDSAAKIITVASATGAAVGAQLSESICIILAVDTDQDTTDGDYNIEVTAESSLNSTISNDMDVFLRIEAVCGLSITPDHSDQLPPGGTTTYRHTVSNSGNFPIDVRIDITPPVNSLLNYRILDSSGNEVGGTQYDIAPLAEGESQSFYVKVFASSETPQGTIEELDITAVAYAVGDLGGVPVCDDTSKDTTTIIDGFLLLEKAFLQPIPDYDGYDYANDQCYADGAGATPDGIPNVGVDPADSAGPCDIITYQIKYTNIGDQDAVNVIVTDSIPDHTTYVPGSLLVDTGCDPSMAAGTSLTDGSGDDTAEYDAGLGLVRFRVGTGADAVNGGTLAPNESGCVIFQVRIK